MNHGQIGSQPLLENTNLIRRRIANGEVKGPRILTVGEPFWTKAPIYVKDFPQTNHISIPEVESPSQAAERVRQQIRDGADGIKIFTGSVQASGILIMPLDLAKAIVGEAHRAGKPVFAHLGNQEAVEAALQSGVDILAHTTPEGGLWPASLVARLKSAHMALIPTLTLWHVEFRGDSPAFEKGMNTTVLPQLRAYSDAGGQILWHGCGLHRTVRYFRGIYLDVPCRHELRANPRFTDYKSCPAVRLFEPQRAHCERNGCRPCRAKLRSSAGRNGILQSALHDPRREAYLLGEVKSPRTHRNFAISLTFADDGLSGGYCWPEVRFEEAPDWLEIRSYGCR
jgi:hypothetical protein